MTPVNDNFPGTNVTTAPFTAANATLVGATNQPGEPRNTPNSEFRSIWYNWTAPTSGEYAVHTVGSPSNTTLGVYTGNSVDGLTQIGSNDDIFDRVIVRNIFNRYAQIGPSGLTFNATAGINYKFSLDGQFSAPYFNGPVVFNLAPVTRGTAGNDNLNGTNGSDWIEGGAGDDNINGNGGYDVLVGGDGNDNINGGSLSDYLDGGNGSDRINGNGGDDIVFAGAGNDTIAGGSGNDSIDGGSGNDVIFSNGGNDIIYGGDGDDAIYGSSGFEFISGGAGNDTIYGNGGGDQIFADDGDNLIYGGSQGDAIFAGSGNDTIYGNGGGDSIFAGGGDNLIYGGSQRDLISTGSGNDTIYGNGGDDSIFTGSGFDTVWLGGGSATVTLEIGEGFDTINNFQLGQTRFQLGSGLTKDELSFTDTADGVKISARGDELAVVSWNQASVFEASRHTIFFS